MKKVMNKRMAAVLSSLIMGLSVCSGAMGSGLTAQAASTEISNPRVAEDGTVTWDTVEFGSYEQDLKEFKTEPIKWRILSVNEDGTDALVLADQGTQIN